MTLRCFHFLPCNSPLFRLSFSSPRSLFLIPFTLSLCPISLRGSESGRQIQSLPGKSRRQWTNAGGTGERVWGIVRLGSVERRGKKCFSIPSFPSLLFGSLLFRFGLGATAFLAFKSQADVIKAYLCSHVYWSMDSLRMQSPLWPYMYKLHGHNISSIVEMGGSTFEL